MVACVASDHNPATFTPSWSCAAWEKRRRLNAGTLSAQRDASEVTPVPRGLEGAIRAPHAHLPHPPAAMKPEPCVVPSYDVAVVHCNTEACEYRQPHRLQQVPQQQGQQQQQAPPPQPQPQQLSSACGVSRQNANQWQHGGGPAPCSARLLSAAPSFNPPSLTPQPHHRTIATGVNATTAARHGFSPLTYASSLAPTPATSWHDITTTVTTGTAPSLHSGPGPITTGAVLSSKSAPIWADSRASAICGSITSGGASGAGVVTGNGRPAPIHLLKRRLSSAAATASPSAPAWFSPAVTDMIMGVSMTASRASSTSTSTPTLSSSVTLASSMTHGTVSSSPLSSPVGGADKQLAADPTEPMEWSCFRHASDSMLPETLAPATPPRSPGSRASPSQSYLHPQPQRLRHHQPEPQAATPLALSLIPNLGSSPAPIVDGWAGGAPSAQLQLQLQVQGFRMLQGFELAAAAAQPFAAGAGTGPAVSAPRGQVVQVVLRLSPVVVGASGGVEGSAHVAEPAQVPQQLPQAQLQAPIAARLPCSDSIELVPEPFVQLFPDAQPQPTQPVRKQEPTQPLQQPQFMSLASPLPGEQPQPQGQPWSSSDRTSLELTASLPSYGWLPADSAIEPALPGMERLLRAAEAAATAAASAAEPFVSCPSQLPGLPMPRLAPEAFFESDGSLMRGAVLQPACLLIRLAKLLRAGLTVSLPWAEPDAAASTAADSATPGSTGTTAAAPPRCGCSPPVGLPQLLSAGGRRSVPLAAVLKALTDFAGAARALQRAEARPSSSSSVAAAAPPEYRALWPLMRRGRKCAEALMVRVERVLTGGEPAAATPLLSPADSHAASA